MVLAAGQSRRMGAANKLLAEIDGTAMVARVVDAVAQSQARPVVVVTGHQRQAVEAALADRDVAFVHNPDYAAGLSARWVMKRSSSPSPSKSPTVTPMLASARPS